MLEARAAAQAEGLGERVSFVQGDAEALPLPDGSFDAVLCECSLCTFPDKARAVAEMARVLRPGGRVAISDVLVDNERLPEALTGPMAVACIGAALTQDGYRDLLAGAGLEVFAMESRHDDAANLAWRVEESPREARLLGFDGLTGPSLGNADAIELARMARRAISNRALAYAILAAAR